MEYCAILLIVFPMIIVILSLFSKYDSFFDLRSVFIKHLGLFKNSRRQYIIFYFMPLLVSIGLTYFYSVDDDLFGQLNVILSIFVSVMLTSLSLLAGKKHDADVKVRKVIEETSNAIIFCVCLCFFLLLLGIILLVVTEINQIALKIVSACTFYLFQIIILNMLLVFKRMSKLLE